MSSERPPSPSHPPDDVGPDLLAYVRGELDAARAQEIEALLRTSSDARTEHDRLAADHAAWTEALAADAPEPRRETLDEILAEVADEAAARRATAAEVREAAPTADVPDDLAADAVALGLGQLDGSEQRRVRHLVADDVRLAAHASAAADLAAATRQALALEPRPESLALILERVAATGPAPVQFDTQDVPAPGVSRRGHLRLLGWLAPLAAAAVLVVALQPHPPGAARISEGTAFVGQRSEGNGATHNGEWLHAGDGPFEFDYGDVVGAGTAPLTVRVACGDEGGTPAVDGDLLPGTAEFVLEPGARLARVDAAHFDLLEGRVRITARELVDRLEVRSGALYAAVTGTRFDATAVDDRLFVIVESGTVRLGRRGDDPTSVVVAAGEQGLVDAERVARAPLDGRSNGDALLTPRARLRGPSSPLRERDPLQLEATLLVGEGGPVTIAGFDASVPLFLVRLTGPEGRALEVKVQESMLTKPAPQNPSVPAGLWRLYGKSPYRLSLSIPGLELEPGTWEARLRYMSYRSRADTSSGHAPPWLGAVESEPVRFEVNAR